MWYEYCQNNSGGSFDVDDKVCRRLLLEADSEDAANKKAFSLGVYFDGCDDGTDCECCGDRWYEPIKKDFPYRYTTQSTPNGMEYVTYETPEEYAQYIADKYGFTTPDYRIYYADGRVVEIFTGIARSMGHRP